MIITPQAAAQELLDRQAAQETIKGFTTYTFSGYEVGRHHQLMFDKLEAVLAGKIRRIMFFLPPRAGKSLIVSRRLPAFFIGRNPGKFATIASYEDELAKEAGRDLRNLVSSSLYQNIFPGVSVMADSKAAGKWNTPQGGGFIGVGIGSGLTGRGSDLAIIDDVVKDRLQADSEAYRARVKDWYSSTFYTRLQPGAAIIICMTRWHVDDLAGWLLDNDKSHEWDVVSLPALAEENDLLGRKPGEALWPGKWSAAELIEMRDNPTKVGAREFRALYQQSPVLQEGSIIKVRNFKRWNPGNLPGVWDLECISMDTSFSGGESNSFTVIQHWGKSGALFYLLDQVRGQWDATQQLNAFRIFCDSRPWIAAKLIEKKANGAALISMLERWVPGLIPINPDQLGSKEQRALAIVPFIDAGNVYIPETGIAPWVDEFIVECAQFNHGKWNDQVDTTTQAVNWLARTGSGFLGDYTSQMASAFSWR